MTARETLARRLTKARDRTLRLVEFDDAELHRQYDPLMSPLVWDLAHIGQQEELWLLRGGNPNRPGMLSPDVERLYDAFENSPGQPGRLAAAAAVGCAGLLRDGARQGAGYPRLAGRRRRRQPGGVQLRAGDQPREPARRNDAAGAEPAVRVRRCWIAGRRFPRADPVWQARPCWCPAARSSSVSTR